MAGPDIDRVTAELEQFIAMTVPHNLSADNFITARSGPAAKESEVIAALEVVEPILNAFYPTWREENPVSTNYRWRRHHESARRCLARIQKRADVEAMLGDAGPELAATNLHRWVWEAARPQWESGHFGEAVHAAGRNVNSQLQARLGRRDVGDAKLVGEAFSREPAQEGRPRLRLAPDDGSETYRSLQDGAAAFGAGCFKAIRNPASHDPKTADMPELEALEYLAAFSILARWVERADVETTG
jgi:uncharacterized protein (TIGR02391 family)